MKLDILPAFPSYFVRLRFPFHRYLKDWVRELPGVEGTGAWDKSTKTWRVPASYLGAVEREFRAHGFTEFEYASGVDTPELFLGQEFQEKLRWWQCEGARGALIAPGRRYIFGFTTGAGKSATALETVRLAEAKTMLIVCPNAVRYTWVDQIERWWPDAPHVEIIRYGRSRKLSKKKTLERDNAYMAPTQIVSYDLVHEVQRTGWDAIIFDEISQGCQWPTSARAKACYELSKYNPRAVVLGLTATLAPTEPQNLFGPLHVLHPDAWGKPEKKKKQYPSFAFCRRYMHGYRGEYGWKFEGVDEDAMEELRERLDTCFMRITEEDIRDEIPAVHFDVARVEDKTEFVVDWAASREMCLVFTWYRDKAEEYASLLGGRYIHGELDAKARNETIKEAVVARMPLVATMSSAGTGIDLGAYGHVLIAEIPGRAEAMTQAAGRIAGLRRSEPSFVTFLIGMSARDRKRAWVVAERLNGVAKGYKLGDAETKMLDLLDTGAIEEEIASLELDMEIEDMDFEE